MEKSGIWYMAQLVYQELLHLAVEGKIAAVVTSPNCRTRSVLRRIQVPHVDLPGPSRKWGGEEWGLDTLSTEEKKKCLEDDIMLFRSVMLFVVAKECAKAEGRGGEVDFVFEHPKAPEKEEVVSYWRTPQWKRLRDTYLMKELHVDQGELGGGGRKPTTLGTSLMILFPEAKKERLQPRCTEGKTKAQIVEESKSLARWTPVLTCCVAEALLRKQGYKVKVRSWRTHVMRNHFPFRKDCQVCQEAAAKGRPHRRQRLPPRAGVLSLDVAGPLTRADELGKGEARFILVGALTWPTGYEGEDEESETPDVEEERKNVPSPGLEELDELLKQVEDEEKVQVKAAKKKKEQEVEEDETPKGREEVVEEEAQERGNPDEEDDYEATEPAEDMPPVQMKVYRMAIPMASKSTDNIMKTVIEMYLIDVEKRWIQRYADSQC